MLLLPLAEGVCVNLRGGGDGRVAEAFADGRQVHAFLQQKRCVAVAHGVEACSLGKPSASGKAWRPFPTTPEAYRVKTTALANDPSESFPPSCFFVGSLSVWWRVGTLAAAAASPQGETPGRRNCRAWLPTNTSERPLAFRRPWRKALAAVRVLAARRLSRFSPGVSHTEVDRKRYPDNLCRLPLVWSNFFKI